MTGKVHTQLPTNVTGGFGEYYFAHRLSEISDEYSELWFQIDNLPNVPEIDAIIVHPDFGFFVIEIKGDNIDQVLEYNDGQYEQPLKPNQNRAPKQKPINQVRIASRSLKSYFETHKVQSVWIQQAVAFPNITRSEWSSKFSMKHPTNLFIFKEDLDSWEYFKLRLQALNRVALVGKVQPMRIMTNSFQLDVAKKILIGDHSDIYVTNDEKEAILRPKDNFRQKASRYLNVQREVIEVKGKAGTGKTLFLMEWLQQRAAIGENVLLVTYNKCLATELRRSLYAVMPVNASSKGSVNVYDIYDLRESIISASDIELLNLSEDKYENKWLSLYEMTSVTYPQFDAVAIDEAQDFSEYYYPLLRRVSSSRATWMLSRGSGQELYTHQVKWPPDSIKEHFEIEEFSDSITLNRSIRNAKNLAVLAMAFDEKYPNLDSAVKWARSKVTEPEEGSDLFNTAKERSRIFFQNWTPNELATELVLEPFIRRAFRDNADARPLVLIPSSKHESYALVLQYFRKIECKYIDLITRDNRRTVAQPGEIRLSTFHSSRGIESEDVLVFGLEDLAESEDFEDSIAISPRNLAYVALTRQTRDLNLAINTDSGAINESSKSVLSFVRDLYHALEENR